MYEGMFYMMECEFCGNRTYLDRSVISAGATCTYCGVKQYCSSIESRTIHLNDKVLEQHYNSKVVIPSYEESKHNQKLISDKQRFKQIYPNEDIIYVHRCARCDWKLATTKIRFVQFCPKCKSQWCNSILEQFQSDE